MSSPEPAAGSLQRRLALEFSLALGALLVVLFLVLDARVGRELHARMDDDLLQRAHTIAAFLRAHPDPVDLAELGRLMPEYELPAHTDFFELSELDGASRVRSASSAGHGLARPERAVAAHAPVHYDTRLPDGHAGRAVAIQLADTPRPGDPPRLLVVARERAPHDALERAIHRTLLAGIVLAIALSVLIAHLAVHRGLAPLRRFGRRIAALDARTPPREPLRAQPLPRELQPFAHALDGAFARLYATIDSERRFSRDVAHELRTPLAEIRASIEAASRAPADAAATRVAFEASIEAVERMQRAIDTLLMLAQQEAGLATAALDPLDLAPLLDGLLATLLPGAQARAIHIRRELPEHLWLRSDVGALERILSNLLRNAIEYAPPRSTLTLALDGDGAGAYLCITNPAPDLHEDDLPRLGQRFWRKARSGGTAAHAGLGLALSHALARSLGLQLDFRLRAGTLQARLGPLPLL